MDCCLTEEDLWSGLDRNAPEVLEHLIVCPSCGLRAEALRAGMGAIAEASVPPAPDLPSAIGSYSIRCRLGEGGMGIVYEGEQQTPKRSVAIKVIRGGRSADDYHVRLFQREAQTLARLRHPAIAAIYEAGRTAEGQHFFAMELVHGLPLTEYTQSQQIPRRRRLQLFCQICDAIHYAHQRGVIHRDLKPTNILVDADGQPRILDFGLARISDSEGPVTTSTDVGRLMGTLAYMSPEEARGNPDEIDVRSDVYSLGVILYQLLTDALPYNVRRAALPEAIRTICEEPPRRPSTIDRTLRGDLETVVRKALEKEPDRRYQSVTALSDDVQRFLRDQPIQARRANTLYRLRKFVVRHPSFVTFAAASLVLFVSARFWVDRLEAERRAATATLFDLQDERVAIIENKLGETLLREEKHDEAEPHLRNALDTFRRLARDSRTAPALTGLAVLLMERNRRLAEPSELQYEEAEALLLEALRIYAHDGGSGPAEQRRALELLQVLYSPDVWDAPKGLAQVAQRLAELEALTEAGQAPPSAALAR